MVVTMVRPCRASRWRVVTTSWAILASSPEEGSSTNITEGFTCVIVLVCWYDCVNVMGGNGEGSVGLGLMCVRRPVPAQTTVYTWLGVSTCHPSPLTHTPPECPPTKRYARTHQQLQRDARALALPAADSPVVDVPDPLVGTARQR